MRFSEPARRHDRMNGSERLAAVSTVVSIAIAAAILVIHAGLVPLGQWQSDEYANFAAFRHKGFDHYLDRITTWSPRPISELLIYIYSAAVGWTGNQLIVPFLGGLWIALLAGALVPVLRIPSGSGLRWSGLMVAVTLLALFMSGHRIAEVFYWAQGAAAYLPTLAAISFVTLAAAFGQPQGRRSQLAYSGTLIVAALSSEVGAFFVFAASAVMICLLAFSHVTWQRVSRRDLVGYLVPLLAAGWVIYRLAVGRAGATNEIFGDPLIAHHFQASLLATIGRLPGELLTLEGGPNRIYSALPALLSKFAFALGCLLVFVRFPRSSTIIQSLALASIAIGAAAAIFASLFGAYHQFGIVCCERHETFRECLSLLFIAATARLISLHLPRLAAGADRAAPFAGIAMAVSVLAANVYTYPRLLAEYRNYDLTWEAGERTWRSGRAPGETMTFWVPPFGIVNSAMAWPRGRFPQSGPGTPPAAEYSIGYFGKREGEFIDITRDPTTP